MTPSETAELLALCAAFDSRTIGEADVYAWQLALDETLTLDRAKDAVAAHYAHQTRRVMPADVNSHYWSEQARLAEERHRERQREITLAYRRPALAAGAAVVEGRYGQRVISDPSPWFVAAKKTLADLRARRSAQADSSKELS
jgi:hypothetical protein